MAPAGGPFAARVLRHALRLLGRLALRLRCQPPAGGEPRPLGAELRDLARRAAASRGTGGELQAALLLLLRLQDQADSSWDDPVGGRLGAAVRLLDAALRLEHLLGPGAERKPPACRGGRAGAACDARESWG